MNDDKSVKVSVAIDSSIWPISKTAISVLVARLHVPSFDAKRSSNSLLLTSAASCLYSGQLSAWSDLILAPSLAPAAELYKRTVGKCVVAAQPPFLSFVHATSFCATRAKRCALVKLRHSHRGEDSSESAVSGGGVWH